VFFFFFPLAKGERGRGMDDPRKAEIWNDCGILKKRPLV
jgi:hypothetical protein